MTTKKCEAQEQHIRVYTADLEIDVTNMTKLTNQKTKNHKMDILTF